jgi:hypothetical protein
MRWLALLGLFIASGAVLSTDSGRDVAWAVVRPDETVASRLAQYGPKARARMAPDFAAAGVAYPPRALTLIGLKQEGVLEVYAGAHPDSQRFITGYRIQKASGELGPKLRQGDLQVPEGIYPVESLNPNSRFHLALRVGYPNAFDRAQARRDGRTRLGGDIMIHGKAVSIGCLSMGDEVAENLFVLAAETGLPNIRVLLIPLDFRRQAIPAVAQPAWVGDLYASLKRELNRYPLSPSRD